jgi:hypothetical protein
MIYFFDDYPIDDQRLLNSGHFQQAPNPRLFVEHQLEESFAAWVFPDQHIRKSDTFCGKFIGGCL